MGISKEESIIKLFNESVRAYNNAILLRNATNDSSRSIIEDFNSTCQFFTSIETAIIHVLKKKNLHVDHKFHKNIITFLDNIQPNPLEIGIDLLYLLSYRDTRNAVMHEINLKNENPYPRLFNNGAAFIKEYIDKNAQLEIPLNTYGKFDYTSFLLHCNENFSPYDHTYILIVGSMHDYKKEDLEIISKLPWNIVLDFDCWSKHNGMKSAFYSKLDDILTLHLQDIENRTTEEIHRKDTVWLYCDGDIDLNVPAFNTDGSIPTKIKNWRNFKESSTNKTAHSLLNSFFNKYYKLRKDATTIVNLMDYTESFNSIVENSLSAMDIEHNYIFINDNVSMELENTIMDGSYPNWFSFNNSLYQLIEQLKMNETVLKSDRDDEEIYIPFNDNAGANGLVNHFEYKEAIRYFDLLHRNFPSEEDIQDMDSRPYHEILREFALGATVDWRIIRQNDAVEFDYVTLIYNELESIIRSDIKEKAYYSITHKPGYGGTTMAKQVAWKLHNQYPVLYLKEYSKFFMDIIKSIYSSSRKKMVVFIEEKLINNTQKDTIISMIKSSSYPILPVFVGRRTEDTDNKYAITFFKEADIDQLINFNRKVLSYTPNEGNRLLEMKARDYIANINSELLCPFIVSLSIHEERFIKLKEYAKEFSPNICESESLKRVFVYLCVCSAYINEGLPSVFLSKILGTEIARYKTNYKNLLPLRLEALFYRYLETDKISYHCIRHPKLAEELLRVLISQNVLSYGKMLQNYLLEFIEDIGKYMGDTKQAHDLLKKLFINKPIEVKEYEIDDVAEGDILNLRKCFSPLIGKILTDDLGIASSLFTKLTEKYPDDPYYFAHSARYYAYTRRSWIDARKNAEKAIRLQEQLDKKGQMRNAAPDIYHIKGMCIRQQLYDELKTDKFIIDQYGSGSLTAENFNSIIALVNEAAESFENTKKYASDSNYESVEYACYAWLQMLIRVLNDLKNFEMLSLEIADDYIDTAFKLIEELEENITYTGNLEKDSALRIMEAQLAEYQGDISESIYNWNRIYEREFNSGNYSNCLRACRRRIYLYIKRYEGIENIPENYIDSLSSDLEKGILNSDVLEERDIKLYLKIARFSKTKSIESIASMLEALYVSQSGKKDMTILLYRYILQFIRSYNGISDANGKLKSYIDECRKKSKHVPNRTSSVEFFGTEDGLRRMVNKMTIINKNEVAVTGIEKSKKNGRKHNLAKRKEIYGSNELGVVIGKFRYESDAESYIIPQNKFGKPMPVSIFVRPADNPRLSTSVNDRDVTFKFGFSFDGPRAENMSIDVVKIGGNITDKNLQRDKEYDFIVISVHTNNKTVFGRIEGIDRSIFYKNLKQDIRSIKHMLNSQQVVLRVKYSYVTAVNSYQLVEVID